MIYRELGASGMDVPAVIFGAWATGGWYWGETDDELSIAAIQAGIDSGMNCIDTAPMYGFGHSEEIVGKAIRGRREDVTIATKCGLRWDLDVGEFHFHTSTPEMGEVDIYKNLRSEAIKEECEHSLRRLGVDVIDIYQCHWPDASTPAEETMGALVDLQRQGKIRAIGVSNYTVPMMEECLKAGSLAANQPRYSLLDRRIEGDLLPFCIANNIGVIVYSPLEQGLLTYKVTMDRTFPEGDYRSSLRWFQPHNRLRVLQALDRIEPLTSKYSCTFAQLVINWTLHQPGITSAIVGARSPEQARENAAAADLDLEPAELSMIREVFETLGKPE